MNKIRIVFLSFLFLFGFNLTFSEGCDDYPEALGIPDFSFGENDAFKIKFTNGSEVAFDDFDLMKDSLNFAVIEARADLLEFMEVEVARSCSENTTTNQTARYSLEGKEVDFEKVRTRMCDLSSRTKGYLRGAPAIGNCYDPGKKVLVTIGISNEMVEGAGVVRGAINDSLLETGGTSLSHSECTSEDSDDCEVEEESKAKMPLNKVEAFSNTEKLKKF